VAPRAKRACTGKGPTGGQPQKRTRSRKPPTDTNTTNSDDDATLNDVLYGGALPNRRNECRPADTSKPKRVKP
jgi:hypothetical protein